MAIDIFDVEQGSESWFRCRAGIPTASCFSDVLANGKSGAESKTRKSYMRKLAAEILTGEPGEQFTSAVLERGKIMEAEARDYYALLHDAAPELVGFIRNGNRGCSPDALLGSQGLLEIKTQRADLLIETLEKGAADKAWIPPEHVAQVQGNLLVSEREWIDLIVYFTKMPVFIRRVYRDEAYLARLSDAIDKFNAELHELVEQVRAYQRAA